MIYIIMELATPIVAIDGLYIACNQNSQEEIANYELPNANVKVKNHPCNIEENEDELIITSELKLFKACIGAL